MFRCLGFGFGFGLRVLGFRDTLPLNRLEVHGL